MFDAIEINYKGILTDYAYSLIGYNLQAMRMDFTEDAVRKYIDAVLI